ncbi:AAA family ATPase [Candidatus Bathyarchaeota archaeon]|nr:AAA family ATPase [Candidatus Bathyarchaeota archaeon]MBS7630996.1 AAA family ATPase [Candidatus Bathyarchaeota archaeon]
MIILLCGGVGAGKSILAQRLSERLGDARVLSSDSFKRRVYERLLLELERGMNKQKYLILDATFYRKVYRDRVRETAMGRDKLFTIYLKCPLEVCLERNRRRSGAVPENAVRIIHRLFEEPENPDLVVNTAEVGVDEALERVLENLRTRRSI